LYPTALKLHYLDRFMFNSRIYKNPGTLDFIGARGGGFEPPRAYCPLDSMAEGPAAWEGSQAGTTGEKAET